MESTFMTATNFALFLLIIALFFHAGHLIYTKQVNRRVAFLNVFIHLIFIGLCSLVLLIVVGVLLFILLLGAEALYEFVLSTQGTSYIADQSVKFRGGNFLLLLTCTIMGAALLNTHLRIFLRKHFKFLQLEQDDFDIIEYFIQWSTIFLAVYQFIFTGLQSAVQLIESAQSAERFFNIFLNPQNINLVMQPILISSWMTIGIEKLRGRQEHKN